MDAKTPRDETARTEVVGKLCKPHLTARTSMFVSVPFGFPILLLVLFGQPFEGVFYHDDEPYIDSTITSAVLLSSWDFHNNIIGNMLKFSK